VWAVNARDHKPRTKEAANMNDTNERSCASRGSALPGELIIQAFKELAASTNDASAAHATNHATLLVALLQKGIVTDEELTAARPRAVAIVDQMFAESRDRKKQEDLDKVKEILERLLK
jgi:hypothetical protein